MVLNRFALFLILITFGQTLVGQSIIYNFGQNKPSTNWQYQLDQSNKIQIVAPNSSVQIQGFIKNKINQDLVRIQGGQSPLKKYWNLIYQRDYNISNGFVTYFNPRIEFYGFYPQDPGLIGTNNWISTLVDHELRHVFQYETSFKYSFPLIKPLLGPALTIAWAGLVVPPWVWEGDAIHKESELNPMGRSQNPSSYNPLLAYLKQFGVPSYQKSIGQSYKSFIPNHYVFGQTLVDSIYARYGEEKLLNSWKLAISKGLFPFSFSHFFKKETGQSIDQFAQNIYSSLKNKWDKTAFSDNEKVQVDSKDIFLNYRSVIPLNKTDFIALRSSFDQIPALVKVEDGKEKILRNFGPRSDDDNLSIGDSLIIFTELAPDIRFGKVNSSKIYLFDLKKDQLILWNKFKSIQSCAISPDGKNIGLVEIGADGNIFLRVLDRVSKASIYVKNFPWNEQISSLQMTDSALVFIQQNDAGKHLTSINYLNDNQQFKIHFGNQNLGYLSVDSNRIFYSKNFEGVDQLFVYDLIKNQEAQLTKSSFGAYFPRMDQQGELWYSNYTAHGLKIEKMVFPQELQFNQVEILPYSGIRMKEGMEEKVSEKPLKSLNRIFGWGYLTPSNTNEIAVGLEMANGLSNWKFRGGINYDYTEKTFGKMIDYSFHKYFPILHLSYVNHQRNTRFYYRPEARYYADSWVENKFLGYLEIPINLTKSSFTTNLNLNLGYSHTLTDHYDLKYRTINLLPNGNFGSIFQNIQFQSNKGLSYLDIYSRLSFIYRMDYMKSLGNNKNIEGEMMVQNLRMNVPGMMKHDVLLLRLGFQNQMVNNYLYNSTLRWPLEVDYVAGNQNLSWGFTYAFPIASVEWELGRIAYFKRFIGRIFYDKAYYFLKNTEENNSQLYSYGLDLSTRVHLFRFFQEFELGVRVMYNGLNGQWLGSPLIINIGF